MYIVYQDVAAPTTSRYITIYSPDQAGSLECGSQQLSQPSYHQHRCHLNIVLCGTKSWCCALSNVQAELGKLSKAVDCGVCRVTTGLRRLNLPRQQQVVRARNCSAVKKLSYNDQQRGRSPDCASSRFRTHICLPVCYRTTRLRGSLVGLTAGLR